MNDVRKVLGDLVRFVRENFTADPQYFNLEFAPLRDAEQFLAPLPADGGAWYPRASDLRAARPWWNWGQTQDATNEAIARLAIDLYKERGGQVGGQVVRLYRREGELSWTEYHASDSFAREDLLKSSAYQVRELIARQPGAQPDRLTIVLQPSGVHLPIQRREDGTWESVDRGDGTPYFGQAVVKESLSTELETEVRAWLDSDPMMIRVREGGGPENLAASLAVNLARMQRQPAHGPVVDEAVAWRHSWGENCVVYSAWSDAPVKEWAHEFVKSMPGARIELAYSHPATVPTEVMEAAEWLASVGDGDCSGPKTKLIRDYLRSLQGAGHGLG